MAVITKYQRKITHKIDTFSTETPKETHFSLYKKKTPKETHFSLYKKKNSCKRNCQNKWMVF